MIHYTVHFLPADIRVQASPGDTLLQAAVDAGIHINASCGGSGACGKCRIRIVSGLVSAEDSGGQLTAGEIAQGWRLACKAAVQGDLTVEVPAASLNGQFRESRCHASRHALQPKSPGSAEPPVQACAAALEPPTAADNASDYARLERSLRKAHGLDLAGSELAALQSLPHAVRQGGWTVQVLVEGGRVLRVQPGKSPRIAVAFDIGTTSIWAQAIDMSTGAVLAEASAYNPQIACGDDVISRIVFSQKQGGLGRLQRLALDGCAGLLDELYRKSGLSKESVTHVTAAGNTVMAHLLLGIEPKYLRESPYVPAITIVPPLRAAAAGFDLAPWVPLYLLPCVASYVGGDIVAGVAACGMHASEEITLYMDLGTNGEIVLGNQDWLMTASCSAGPAFEGGGLACGMRAMPGAVEGFSLGSDRAPMVLTIGSARPLGICGSGTINILAAFMRAGIISQNGRFDCDHAAGRLRQGTAGSEYVIVEKEFSASGSPIVITEADIDNIIRAKAAMFAGCHALVEHAGLAFSDIDRVIIAGAFGDYVDIENAITIGLFPDIPRERYSFFGNGSLHGARLAACSRSFMAAADATARRMTNVELSEDRSFMDKYIAGMFLPHTDGSLFPSVSFAEPPEGSL